METDIFKRKKIKARKKSAPEVLGKCPVEECNGNVQLHSSKEYVLCNCRFEGACKFTLNRNYLKPWGINQLSIVDIRDLLAMESIEYEGMWNPTGQYHCDCSIKLEWIPVTQKFGLKINIQKKYAW